MKRWLPALFAALFLHGLLFLIPVVDSGFPALKSPVNRTIRVQLESAPAEAPEEADNSQKKPPILKTPSPARPPLPVLQPGSRKKTAGQPRKNRSAARGQTDNHPAAPTSQSSPRPSTGRNQPTVAHHTIAVPLYRQNKKPVYPLLARKRGWQGTVILEVTISPDGLPLEIVLLKSSSYALLDKSALKAVQSWCFTPALNNGQPVTAKVQVPVHFSLK